ncbi:polysaccharide pyruvyl transferase family protein [Allosalinactinospora lopnorensis]|uniref:polysaccharide pyruvyl transferase family protein n=1 Tax=Allosalinactinospora lopnorensis TaxID=1352348 RepID=UPI000623C7A9|nr:polysaccharide pyruvyl transferase family protein [Allosalinactinospora lopnorensis]
MRVLLVGWFSFLHGEATAGDVRALEVVQGLLSGMGIAHDAAWSPVFRPDALSLEETDPDRYSHLVFVCGPLYGEQVERLHTRFRRCRRIAVGVSVIDPDAPVTTGFSTVLARDGGPRPARWDLTMAAPDAHDAPAPVVGVMLAAPQEEYRDRARHTYITERVTDWVSTRDCAPVPISTRLDYRSWRHCTTPAQLTALLRRMDLTVTMRLHGMVFALRAGVPAIAVDPVAEGAKISAQARALNWPAVITPERINAGEHPGSADFEVELSRQWDWCLSPEGRRAAAGYQGYGERSSGGDTALLDELARTLRA